MPQDLRPQRERQGNGRSLVKTCLCNERRRTCVSSLRGDDYAVTVLFDTRLCISFPVRHAVMHFIYCSTRGSLLGRSYLRFKREFSS